MISVLIADDEKLTRNTLKKTIPWQELGIEAIFEATNGREAFELVQLKRPDIIITDIKMPHLNGIEFLRKLREGNWPSRLIILSGYANKEYLKDAIHLHVDGFIEKPLNPAEITAQLRSIINELQAQHAGNDTLLFFRDGKRAAEALNQTKYVLSKQVIESFSDALSKKDYDTSRRVLNQMCDEMRLSEATDPDYIRSIFSRLALQFEQAAQLHGATDTLVSAEHLIDEISGICSFSVLENAVIGLLESFFKEVQNEASDLTSRVYDYLSNHFKNANLCIDDIAHHFMFNPTYLCTVFKQKSGKTINSVLTDIRMQEARRLLTETDLKLYRIGEMVGYRDGKYFTKIFTRETGISPREYRNRHHV